MLTSRSGWNATVRPLRAAQVGSGRPEITGECKKVSSMSVERGAPDACAPHKEESHALSLALQTALQLHQGLQGVAAGILLQIRVRTADKDAGPPLYPFIAIQGH